MSDALVGSRFRLIYKIVPMREEHLNGVVRLQKLAFPAPFDESLLWQRWHLERHLEIFPEGQFVALFGQQVVGSCSNTLISEEHYQAHLCWEETVGGYELSTFTPHGTTLYGLDISVHPAFRRIGIGRTFYTERKKLVKTMNLKRFATACRLPDYSRKCEEFAHDSYVKAVQEGELEDRSLTPLLRYDVQVIEIIRDYMEDPESGNAAALLEWAA